MSSTFCSQAKTLVYLPPRLHWLVYMRAVVLLALAAAIGVFGSLASGSVLGNP